LVRQNFLSENRKPVLLSFGQDGLSDSEWEKIAGARPIAFVYLSEHMRRKAASGAFDWPSPRTGLKAQEEFHEKARKWPVGMAVAYPRFHDIYEQAKVHASWGKIDDDDGKTFAVTLENALRSGLPFVQISTWNDWGEGTMIEPSTEFGYRDLEVVQRLRRQIIEPHFANDRDDLRLPLRLYKLRKAGKDRRPSHEELDHVAQMLSKGSNKAARESLDLMEKRTRPAR
jgi:Glycosyltransferase WbsX